MGYGMRCLSCNCILSDYEATRKSASTHIFVDLCNRCYNSIEEDLDVIDRPDLEHEESYDFDDEGLDNDELLWYPKLYSIYRASKY